MATFENLSRRSFLGTASAGLVLGFSLPAAAKKQPRIDDTLVLGAERSGATDFGLNAWIRVAEDGVVTVRFPAAEMGQGVSTALPMVLADELDADWSKVRVESAPVDKAYRHYNVDYPGKSQTTGGNLSVRGYWNILREAGATARAMLIEAAALRWDVDVADCSAKAGVVRCGDKEAAFGDLAGDAALLKPPGKVALKAPGARTLMGTSPARLDLPDKVDGKAVFGLDVQIEGMKNATVVACPHHGGALIKFNDAKAREVPGVSHVFALDPDVGQAIAVVADTYWHARKAARLLEIEWEPGAGKGLDTKEVRRRLNAGITDGGKTVFKHGKVAEDLEFTATYSVPYLDHAPIEPVNAVAHVQADRVHLWAPTQAGNFVKGRAAKVADVPASNVFVHTTLLGGGFGRKGFWDFTNYAVAISREVGGPVKLTYSREEMFGHGFYRPAVVCRMSAKLGPSGRPSDWYVEMASQNILEGLGVPKLLMGLRLVTDTVTDCMSEAPYDIENQQVDYAWVPMPIPVGWWRSVHGSTNGFFRESYMDELAHKAGQDPIQYRRAMLAKNKRFLACYDLALEKAGPVPEGMSRGTAIVHSFGSICAQVADVTVVNGDLRVHRVTAAIDCGTCIHPDTVRAQVQGAVGMGLSSMLHEAVDFKDGAAQQLNYDTYKVMGLAMMPEVDVHIVPSNEAPGGVGEPGLPPVLPAVCNAIFNATGKRIRRLPLGDQLKT